MMHRWLNIAEGMSVVLGCVNQVSITHHRLKKFQTFVSLLTQKSIRSIKGTKRKHEQYTLLTDLEKFEIAK